MRKQSKQSERIRLRRETLIWLADPARELWQAAGGSNTEPNTDITCKYQTLGCTHVTTC